MLFPLLISLQKLRLAAAYATAKRRTRKSR